MKVGPKPVPPVERIERRLVTVDLGFTTPCRVFEGSLKQGYGRIYLGRITPTKSRIERAYRVVWEHHHGPVPAGLEIDHLCHPDDGSCAGGETCPHRACCEVTHLGLATPLANVMRGNSPPARNARKTRCVNGHIFDEANTRIAPDGERVCRACELDRTHARRQRARTEATSRG